MSSKATVSRLPKDLPPLPEEERKQAETNVIMGTYPHLHEIVEGAIYLGNERVAGHVARFEEEDEKLVDGLKKTLLDRNIGGIVSCVPRSNKFEKDFKYCNVPLGDNPKEKSKLSKIFLESFGFIERIIKEKKAVYIHCNMGMSRSATVTIAYLMRKNAWSFEKAYMYTRNIRKIITPNEGFCEALLSLEKNMVGEGNKLEYLSTAE
mmetsp:Transcript_11045/g.15314  ORF Transcript_11045/g.15314 Transcript_11045/m.15314 type:complete len:207 (+) Transcript_11045:29-649(+)